VPSVGLALQGFSSKDSLVAAVAGNSNFTQCSRIVLAAIFDDNGGYQLLTDSADVDIFATSNDAQSCRAFWGSFDPASATASVPFQPGKSFCPTMDYFKSLFVAAQVAIDSALFGSAFAPSFYAAPLRAYKQYLGEGFTRIVGPYLSFGLIYYGLAFSVSVVSEKESKVRDAMRMMGCPSAVIYSSWICTTALLQLPIVIIFAIALQVSKIIYQSNFFILFITIFIFILSQTAQYGLPPLLLPVLCFALFFARFFIFGVTSLACTSCCAILSIPRAELAL
jgi:hypothetical protein